MGVLAAKLLKDGRVTIEDTPYLPPVGVVHKYLNDTLQASLVQVPLKPGETRRVRFRMAAPMTPDYSDRVFSMYCTAAGRGWWPSMVDTAVSIFKELVPGREPMWYFDADTYHPWVFDFDAFDAEEMVGSALVPFLRGGRGGQ
ncbi:hypothetical protein TRAPUB_9347 [Trametes pubescens]|uniref:Uncharacterized protein n=1 Tax=Trametes pubescens TaxID=154538 RepID=A0A1M2W2L2_TRAPU|nr:hypothetical protein TRAPUB_9347 [Trametes pubescens]